MAANGVAMVSTLAVLESWRSFARTTTLPRFAEPPAGHDRGAPRVGARERAAGRPGRRAHRGRHRLRRRLPRANQLAWEIECLVTPGCEPWQALAAATRNGGSCSANRTRACSARAARPTSLLVHGDPLSDPAALWRVWLVA